MSEFNPINKRQSSNKKPDFQGAQAYALGRLERELSPKLIYHSLAHTRDGVVAASERLASMENVDGESLVLLLTAAYFHDIGFVVQCENHEEAGCSIAEEALPEFRYSSDQILAIKRMILATKLPQNPETRPEEILADGVLPEEETVFLCPPQDEAFDARLSEIYQIFEARALIGICTRFWAWLDGIAYEQYLAIVKAGYDVEASGSREV